MKPTKVLMVCLGNICRSPTAQGVFEAMVKARGLSAEVHVDSAGTSAWHIGEQPDPRSQRAAMARGYDLSDQRARQVDEQDFEHFDYILAMDRQNLHHLEIMKPVGFGGHLGLFLAFGDADSEVEVPDPYHGGEAGFEHVIDLIEAASSGLLSHIIER